MNNWFGHRFSKLLGPYNPRQGICISILGSWTVHYIKIVPWESSNPAVTQCIQFGCGQHICQRVVVCLYCKLGPIQVIVEFTGHSPLQRQKLEFVSWVIPLGLSQPPTGIGNNPLLALLTLIKYSPQAIEASICMDSERLGVIGIPQNWSIATTIYEGVKCSLLALLPIKWFSINYGSPVLLLLVRA